MIKEDRLYKLRRRIYMRLYFNTEISTGETKNRGLLISGVFFNFRSADITIIWLKSP